MSTTDADRIKETDRAQNEVDPSPDEWIELVPITGALVFGDPGEVEVIRYTPRAVDEYEQMAQSVEEAFAAVTEGRVPIDD